MKFITYIENTVYIIKYIYKKIKCIATTFDTSLDSLVPFSRAKFTEQEKVYRVKE